MKEIFKELSTNGRWGLAVVGEEGTQFPAEGSVRPVGRAAGIQTFELVPGNTGTWVLPVSGGGIKIHGGATLVAQEELQSNGVAALLLMGPEAVIEIYGYKRRSSRVVAFIEGRETDIPAPVLATMGLLQVEPPKATEIPPPPPLSGAMATAFAALSRKNA